MKGIRLLRLLDVLPVDAARNAPGVTPRSLIITCNQMRAVDQVLINGTSSPEFAIYSKTQLIAQVPESIAGDIITDVSILSSVPTMTQRSLIEFGVGKRIQPQQGVQRLVQTFVRMLLRTAGSNIFHRTLGGSIGASIGNNVSPALLADVAISVGRVREQIIAAQSIHTAIPAAERLLSAEIGNLYQDPNQASVFLTVILTAHDRQRSGATFVA